MKAPIFQVDAFTGVGLRGNRAAVCLLDAWPPDEILQAIAVRNALSETAFLVQDVGTWDLRWFTPATEVDLCGHATLATAWVVFQHLAPDLDEVVFRSRSGPLPVARDGEVLWLDFPARVPAEHAVPDGLVDGLGLVPESVYATASDWIAVFPREEDVRSLEPDFAFVRTLDRPYLIATAPGEEADFVSRFFAPSVGVDEDPVTGSAHCALAPYWARRLGRPSLHAFQVSANGGEIFCEDRGERVRIGGRVDPYLQAVLEV